MIIHPNPKGRLDEDSDRKISWGSGDPEDQYKADLAVTNLYQSFSGERKDLQGMSNAEQDSLSKDLVICARLIAISSIALVVGASSMAHAFVFTLLRLPG